ncbi:hypothetical protein [Staphylococcus chromogenes]|uniref:hypothetical protein n=2 Tax=Staphylococcus chromogenes TaxID=46126 RepID=UPI0039E129F8
MKTLLRAIVGIGLIYASAQYFGWTPQSQYLPQLNFDIWHSRLTDTLNQLSTLQTLPSQALNNIPYDAL